MNIKSEKNYSRTFLTVFGDVFESKAGPSLG